MKILLTLAVLLIGNLTLAQNAQKIIGKWAYVDISNKTELDEATLEMAPMIFKDLSLNFRPDGTMSVAMGKKQEQGTYSFDKDNENSITATSQTGKLMHFAIISLTDDEFVVSMGENSPMALIMQKIGEPDAAPVEQPKVAATLKQITGKWYLTGSDGEPMSDMAAELLKDSHVTFSDGGNYHSKVLGIEQKGKWTFGDGNTTILVSTDDGDGIWSIYSVSDTELVMRSNSSVKQMNFSRKQL